MVRYDVLNISFTSYTNAFNFRNFCLKNCLKECFIFVKLEVNTVWNIEETMRWILTLYFLSFTELTVSESHFK
jgi:hypothetical protein